MTSLLNFGSVSKTLQVSGRLGRTFISLSFNGIFLDSGPLIRLSFHQIIRRHVPYLRAGMPTRYPEALPPAVESQK